MFRPLDLLRFHSHGADGSALYEGVHAVAPRMVRRRRYLTAPHPERWSPLGPAVGPVLALLSLIKLGPIGTTPGTPSNTGPGPEFP